MTDIEAELKALQEKVHLLEDKEKIRDLLARYMFNIDLRRYDNFMKLWDEDSVFTTDIAGGAVSNKGKDAIRAFVVGLPKAYMQHLQLDCIIEVHGDNATSTGYQLIPIFDNGNFVILRCSFRTFNFRRIDGEWKITETVSRNITNEAECNKLIPQDW